MGLNDSWETPQWLFDELNNEFHFDIDLCASLRNRKCNWYCDDYLNWNVVNGVKSNHDSNISAFMNPPYSDKLPFIKKAWDDSKYCTIVVLVPVDTSTEWWSVFWEYNVTKYKYLDCKGDFYVSNHPSSDGDIFVKEYKYNGPKPGCEYPRFFNKRIKFDKPKGLETGSSGPTFPSCVLVFDRRSI